MRRKTLYAVILLVGLDYCWGAAEVSRSAVVAPTAPDVQKRTSKEMANYVRSELARNLQRHKEVGKVGREDDRVISLLIDEEATRAKCEEAVIRYLRTRYMNYSMDPGRFRQELFSEHGIVASDLAEAMFWLKGSSAGLYEYYRLTGLSPLSRQFIVDTSDDKDKREMVLRFRLYVLIEDLRRSALNQYVFNRPLSSLQRPEEIMLLRDESVDSGRLREFILNYPFMDGSYVDVRSKLLADPRYPHTSPLVEELLVAYYRAVVQGEADKLSFLSKVNKHYGKQCFSVVSRTVLADPELGPSFYEGLVELAAGAHAWDVIADILERPGGREIIVAKQGALDQAAKELEAEQAVIGAIKSSLSTEAK